MTSVPTLTFSILTIPEREEYLKRLFDSIRELSGPRPKIDVIYNRRLDGALSKAQERIRGYAPDLALDVYFNAGEPTIVSGRNLQLSVCRTALMAFIDDDLTLHGDITEAIHDTLGAHPLGLLGFPSVASDTGRRVKPRDTTPSVDWQTLRFMPVQGMLVATYRSLLADLGGFNSRRRNWGEWTELNLRLWRSGFPTAYRLDRGYLRHWEGAPSSPTRNLTGREQEVVWGLICTALEYDAVDVNEATEVFWHLVEERYLAYSYGEQLSPRNVLKTVLELVPRISAEWGGIQAYRTVTALHRYKFAPFHRFTIDEVKTVYASARESIEPYRAHMAPEFARSPRRMQAPASIRELKGAFGRLFRSIKSLRQQF